MIDSKCTNFFVSPLNQENQTQSLCMLLLATEHDRFADRCIHIKVVTFFLFESLLTVEFQRTLSLRSLFGKIVK